MFDNTLHSGELRFKNARFQAWLPGHGAYLVVNRPVWGLLYLLSGELSYDFENQVLTVRPGDILLLPPGCSYRVSFLETESPTEDLLLNFSLPRGEVLTRDRFPTLLLQDNSGMLAPAFQSVVNAYREDTDPYLTRELFYRCIRKLTSHHTAPKSQAQQTMDHAAKLLCEQPELSVTAIAQRLHMSRSLLQRRFKEYHGISPVDYRNRMRIQAAQRLLEATDIPIKDIADRLGYYDVAYFYKVFCTATGQTPKAYRTTVHPLL